MRDSRAKDYWRRVKNTDKYPTRVESFSFENVIGFDDKISLEFSSAISAICGKNGAGKSTLMRYLFESISGKDCLPNRERVESASFESVTFINGSKQQLNERLDRSNVYYIEPSRECASILDYIKSTQNFDELLQGVDISRSLDGSEIRDLISKIVGKRYDSILFYEINEAMSHPLEYPFPYFLVKSSEVEYTNVNMGMGEFSCLYIVWFILFVEAKSILFIEEPENFISAYSQINLMNFIASISWGRKLWLLISSHSEHILSSIGHNNISILSTTGKNKKSCISKSKNVNRYLSALGVSAKEKGCFIVEDEFASLFLHKIIRIIDTDILNSFSIIQVECESNIESVVNGFLPKVESSYEMIAVFDADQWSKIPELSTKKIFVTSLPSASGLAPEKELWPILQDEAESISEALHINYDDLLESIDRFETDNHHQKIQKVCDEMKVALSIMVDTLIYVWAQKEHNKNLLSDFHSAMKYRGKTFNCTSNVVNLNLSGNGEEFSLGLDNDKRNDKTQKGKLVFDGKKLLVI
ncbi:ATP-dependent nuclease [Aeromonas jandaei]|uniref:ATP-dependent nuclease n=1 Tax=Aeromonas jandaei TaxID=650 RepID=UPI000AABD11E|nr:AAA family ATPase [Aeromonas jandaei]